MPFSSRLLPVDTLLFSGDTLCLGRFAAPIDHPLFAHNGPADTYYIAFPRTPVWIRHEGRGRFLADATVATCYNPGDIYYREAADPAGDRADWVALAADVAREITTGSHARSATRDRVFSTERVRCGAAAFVRQRRLFDGLTASSSGSPLRIEESALRIVAGLLRADEPPPPGRPHARHLDLVEHTRYVLARRFRERLTLSSIAREVEASPFHLCRTFHRCIGLTMSQYQEQLRLRAAIERLQDSRARLIDIAIDAGFSSHSHFTAAFRRVFGITPSEFRRAEPRLAEFQPPNHEGPRRDTKFTKDTKVR